MWLPGNKIDTEVTLKLETLNFEIAQLEFKISARLDENKAIAKRIDELKMSLDYATKEANVVSISEIESMKGNVCFFEAMLRRNGDLLIQLNKELDQARSDLEDFKLISRCKIISLEAYKNAKKTTS